MAKLLVVERKISIQKKKPQKTPRFGDWVNSDVEYLMGMLKKRMMKNMAGWIFDQGPRTIVFLPFSVVCGIKLWKQGQSCVH